jgi:hypothetical protein
MGLNVNNVNMYNSPSVYQAAGVLTQWDWQVGSNQNYWGFSIRCDGFWAGARVEIQEQWTTYDDRSVIEHFVVSATTLVPAGLPTGTPQPGLPLTFHAVQVD